jgi:hypothetical protein
MRSPLFLLGLLAVAACDAPTVEWGDPVAIVGTPNSRLVIDAGGHPRFVPDSSGAPPISVPGACQTSIRAAWSATRVQAVWWGVRADSSAVLYITTSSDSGKTWGAPLAVDTADVGATGCRRPPPSVVAVGDDVHIAYSMTASEGTGVFFAHFLNAMIHSPVAVIYGERLVSTAIAAEGDRVAVVYEDPNGGRRQVAVALSSTQGHIFEWHGTASRDIDAATDPAVALAGQTLAVSWATQQAADSVATRVVRVGRLH